MRRDVTAFVLPYHLENQEVQAMGAVLLRGGQLAGLIGILLIVVSAVARLAGKFTLGGFATGTLMLAGIGALSVGCFLLLWLIAERGRR